MKVVNKNLKKKRNKIQNNEITNLPQFKQEDIEEDRDLIKNNNKKKKYSIYNYNEIEESTSKVKISKVLIMLLVIFSINKIYENKSIKSIPEEILKLKDNSLKWYQRVQLFFDICTKGLFLYKKRYKKKINPKFSLVIPVLNKRDYLLKLICSIQNQLYENIEIIFVDDHSTDGSIELIEQYKRKDKRIVLIKHEKNKGTLITRNDGVLNAKGEYILFIDPDDMILENSLQKLNEATLKYNDTDVIQFRAYKKIGTSIFPWARGYKEFDKMVNQPELCSIMFYENGILNQINFFIWAKIFKRTILIEAINKLNEKYNDVYMTLYEDVAMLFIILQIAKNYIYVNIYGYLYCLSNASVFENRYKYRRGNRTIRDCFLLSEILFDFSKNTKYDKLMAIFTLNRIYWLYYNVCSFITQGFDYIYKVLNKFLKCEVLTLGNKYYVFKLKKLIEERQKELK